MTVALEGLRGRDRREWTGALDRTRESWENAYERRPASGVEQQFELISADRDELVIERPCEACGAELASRRGDVKYCNTECRREAWRVRRRKVAA